MNFLELTSSGKRGYHWEDPMQSMICCAVAVVLRSWMKCIFSRSRRRQCGGKRKKKKTLQYQEDKNRRKLEREQ